ncbi:MAG: hypothetical protein AAF787_13715, partial [Chloroflexota bacterium]
GEMLVRCSSTKSIRCWNFGSERIWTIMNQPVPPADVECVRLVHGKVVHGLVGIFYIFPRS